jgi:Tol biopolymer transport system component
MRIKLQGQPYQVLTMLLEHPGVVVTREELRKRLWDAHTTVDFDHSLGVAINKIREALGDSADHPHFVETLPRRGFRFVAPVEKTESNGEHPLEGRGRKEGLRWLLLHAHRSWVARLSVASIIILAGLFTSWLRPPFPPPKLLRAVQITNSGRVYPGDLVLEHFPNCVTDGTRIYFQEMRGGSAVLAQVSAAAGDAQGIPTPPEIVGPSVTDISPDGSRLLIRNRLAPEVEQPFWIVAVLGGAARRLGNVQAHDATWSPDGQSIIYAAGRDLILAKSDGGESRKLVTVSGRAFWPRWSPDGSRLRFTIVEALTRTMTLWEVSSDGSNLHPLLPDWNNPPTECCGTWTPDGNYFIFQSTREGTTNVWAMREKASLFRRADRNPVQVTAGPLNFLAPVPGKDGKRLYVVGAQTRTQLLRYDQESGQFLPYLAQIGPVSRVELSVDGQWVAYVSLASGSLWRCRVDGSQRLQLTAPPMQTYMMRWSPDGRWIVFMGKVPGKPWKLFLISTEGGNPQQLLPEEHNEADPGWSPDGNSLVFGRLPESMAEDSTPKAIHVLDVRTRKFSTLPGSEGLFSPRWSPDGRYIAAMPLDQNKLMLFDFTTQKWVDLSSRSVDNPVWSHDSSNIYFRAFMEDGQPIYRLRISDRNLKLITDFKDLRREDVTQWRVLALASNDSLLVSAVLSTADIYALDWEAP